MKRRTMIRREQGVALLESLLALMAFVTLTTLSAMVLRHHSRQSAALSTAQLLKKSGHSVRAYLEDHSDEMNNIKILSKSKLIDAGYFFPQQPNAYQQHHHLQIVRGASQTHVCIMTRDGKPIPPKAWKWMKPLLKGYGGYCHRDTGELIDWEQPPNAQLTPLLTPGHLVLCYPLQTAQMPSLASVPDRLLYRKKIPTHPQYQQMKTHLDMQQHVIDFEAPQQQGALRAQGLEFQHTTPTGRHRAAIEWTSQGKAYQVTLQAPEQQQLRISPSAMHLTAPSIIAKQSQFNYDTVKKRVTLIPPPPIMDYSGTGNGINSPIITCLIISYRQQQTVRKISSTLLNRFVSS